MAYTSKINIRLGEVPKTSNGEFFADLVDIYNACHILAQYVSQLVDRADPPENNKPWEHMPFNNSFWAPAAVDINAGSVVHINGATAYLGASMTWPIVTDPHVQEGDPPPAVPITVTPGTIASVFGVALTTSKAGQPVKIGVGPAILHVTGVSAGSNIYAASGYDGAWQRVGITHWQLINTRLSYDGGLYQNVTDYHQGTPHIARWVRGYVKIGYAVAQDAVYLQPTGLATEGPSRDIAWV